MEYLDLYLVHFPVSLKAGSYEVPFDKTELVAMDMKAVWEGMEECHRLGLSKSIGVSNFSCKKLQDLLATAKIRPVVNQVSFLDLSYHSRQHLHSVAILTICSKI